MTVPNEYIYRRGKNDTIHLMSVSKCVLPSFQPFVKFPFFYIIEMQGLKVDSASGILGWCPESEPIEGSGYVLDQDNISSTLTA